MEIPGRTAALLAVVFALLLNPPAAAAQDTSENNWRYLFNGRDLTGWKELNGDHVFEARDGEIVGATVPGEPNGFLVTEEEFGDFVLELEVRVDVLMNNSGIQFRSLSREDYRDFRVHGYQAEIDTKPQRWSGSIYDEARRGWLYIMELNPEAKDAFVNNTWNHYRIEAVGTTNRVWVNGVPTAHLVDDETTQGFIGLQLHANNPDDPPGSHRIRFRSIRIRTEDLEPSPFDDIFVVNLIPNTLSGQEREQGFVLLWDGSSLDGWTGLEATSSPRDAWSTDDDALRGVPAAVTDRVPADRTADRTPTDRTADRTPTDPTADSGDSALAAPIAIASEAAFAAFELKFEFKPLTEDATCGIHYLVSGDDAVNSSQYCRMASQKLDERSWNQGVIRVLPDRHVEYRLNGYEILEYRRAPDEPARGRIVLEHGGGEVAYRSIKIRELD